MSTMDTIAIVILSYVYMHLNPSHHLLQEKNQIYDRVTQSYDRLLCRCVHGD